jgi:hypothetical protein
MLVVAIAVIGTISLRYQSSIDARRAEVAMPASRLALMMVETWRGVAGTETFDPVSSLSSEITIEKSGGPTEPAGYSLLGTYKVQLNNVDYYTGLSYKDINAVLRALNVTVEWEQGGRQQATADESDKSFALTLYVEK